LGYARLDSQLACRNRRRQVSFFFLNAKLTEAAKKRQLRRSLEGFL
jgi:hypothetical protein